MDSQKQLRRSNNKMIAGVAAGVAEYFNLDPALVRLGFVLLFLAGGAPGPILYFVLLIVMPPAPGS